MEGRRGEEGEGKVKGAFVKRNSLSEVGGIIQSLPELSSHCRKGQALSNKNSHCDCVTLSGQNLAIFES